MRSGARCRRVAPVTLLSRVIAETVRGPPGARRAKYRSGGSAEVMPCGCPLGAVSTHPGPAPSGWSPITARRRSSLASIGRDRADYLLPEGHWLFLCRYFLIIPLEILHSQFRGQGELHILAGAVVAAAYGFLPGHVLQRGAGRCPGYGSRLAVPGCYPPLPRVPRALGPRRRFLRPLW